jgi:hypothetical protein
MWTLAATVAPAQHLQLAVAPDRKESLCVGEEELHFAFAAASVDAAAQPMPRDQLGGQFTQRQGDAEQHASLRSWPDGWGGLRAADSM